jgi:GNAT superfamily N-acetyltransferase
VVPPVMAQLGMPTVAVHASFLAGMAEFRAEGRGGPGDATEVGREIRTFGGSWASPEGFAAYVRWLVDQAREDSPRWKGYVPATTLWLIAGQEYLARIAIRHRLTDRLRQAGGHIGYDVRPSARRRGYATTMLREALPVARSLGITAALPDLRPRQCVVPQGDRALRRRAARSARGEAALPGVDDGDDAVAAAWRRA